MPRVVIPLTDVGSSVIRPVAFSIIRDVLSYTGLRANSQIVMPANEEDGNYLPRTTLSSELENREKHLFGNDSKIFLELDEEYTDEGAITDAVMRQENIPIFLDENLEVLIKPVYTSIQSVLSIIFRSPDRVTALKWRDALRSKIQMGFRELVHKVDYHYLIPQTVIDILGTVNDLKENIDGYNETLLDYVERCITKRRTYVSSLDGKTKRLAITEKQHRVLGWFDFGVRPEKSEKTGAVSWSIRVNYNYTYNRPISLVMQYPLVVHNQLLPREYRRTKRSERTSDYNKIFTLTQWGLNHFEHDRYLDSVGASPGVYLPEYDDFVPRSTLPHSIPVFTGLVLIDEDTDKLMNFDRLGSYKFPDIVREFLISETPFIGIPYKSLFDLSFFSYRDLIDPYLEPIKIMENLDVVLQRKVSLRNYYHVRLGICSDLSLLDQDAKDRLRKYPEIIDIIDGIINPGRPNDNLSPDEKLDDMLNDGRSSTDGRRIIHPTVQGLIVRSRVK